MKFHPWLFTIAAPLAQLAADTLQPYLAALDLVLVLCVSPGQGGQAFQESQLAKIAAVRKMIEQSGQPIELEVDGGVSPENAGRIVRAGGHVLVSGSKIFDTPDRAAAISALRNAASAGRNAASAG